MYKPKVSVIIPVYNVEKYIERCARSLFEQTLIDLEYIFIDDFSFDNSIAIMQSVLSEYPERSNQVKILSHEENKGVSRSRQEGVNIAEGEYIIHCDPDDWVEDNMYQALYEHAIYTNADLVICDFYYVSQKSVIRSIQRPATNSNIAVLKEISANSNKTLHGSLCNKLIKSELYKSAKFPVNINYCEDALVLIQMLQSESIIISYLDKSLYYYDISRPGSIVKTINPQAIQMDLNLMNLLDSEDIISDKYRSCKDSYIISILFSRTFLHSDISNTSFSSTYKKFESYIASNKRLHCIDKILLKIAMHGNFKFAQKLHYSFFSIYEKLNRIKRRITQK